MNRPRPFLFAILIVLALPAFAKVSPDEFTAACAAGDKARVEELLAAGAEVSARDSQNRLPLLCAVFSQKAEIVDLLLQRGADPNEGGNCGEKRCSLHPALPLAVELGDVSIVKLLLAAKADVAWGEHRPVHAANIGNRVEILRLLRAAGGKETGREATESPRGKSPQSDRAALSGLSKLLPAIVAPARKAGAKLRVAIVAENELQPAADLLAASLADASFSLVERAELHRILNEHQLTAQLGADGARASEIGALLGADALVLLRKVRFEETDSLELSFVRVLPGIVLDSALQAWPFANGSAWAADAAARLANLDPKLRDDHAIAIATAPFRPLTDASAAHSLARECLLLLDNRLAHQPGLVLLERESVDLVAREQTIGKAPGFWAGSYLLDGTVELYANDAAQVAITLRLSPISAGEAKTFTIRGPRTELPRLVGELIAQTNTALKLHSAPRADLSGEARRQFDESRNLFAVGLPLPAYRAAATASAFGLDSKEFGEWRLEVALRLISWQTQNLLYAGDFESLRSGSWDEDWIEKQMRGKEWLHRADWIDAGVEVMRSWQRLLLEALRGDDAERAAELLLRHRSAVGAALAVFHSVDLAATTLDFHAAHLAIPEAVRETLEQALALADAKPVHAANACTISVQLAEVAAAVYRDKASLVAGFTPLLLREFAVENVPTRLAIRTAFLDLGETVHSPFHAPRSELWGAREILDAKIATPHAVASRAALREVISVGASFEDELTRVAFDDFTAQSVDRQQSRSEELFNLFWERRQFFVDFPVAVLLFERICVRVSMGGKNALKFATSHPGEKRPWYEATPEMKKLRRDLFLLVAKNAVHPGPAYKLYDEAYDLGGKDVTEARALFDRVNQDFAAGLVRGVSLKQPPQDATPKPRPVLPKTPTYAKHPPFKVTRRWTTESTPDGSVESFRISTPGFDPDTNTLWLFGEGKSSEDFRTVHYYVFEVSLPSLKTKTWPLPPFQLLPGDNGGFAPDTIHIFPQSDFLYMAKDDEFLAIGNRKTRKWTIGREVQSYGDFARAGDELFLLTRHGGARGLASISLRDQSITVLASNRRILPRTPLDKPDLAALSLKTGAGGLIEITTEPFDATDVAQVSSSEAKPRSSLVFDPARKSWTEPKIIPLTTTAYFPFVPLVAAGQPLAYKKNPASNVWTLQLPRADMPKVRLPIEFNTPAKPASAISNGPQGMLGSWYWVPEGYFFIDHDSSRGSLVYFIPQVELDAYLDSYIPDEDETGFHGAAPAKKPVTQ